MSNGYDDDLLGALPIDDLIWKAGHNNSLDIRSVHTGNGTPNLRPVCNQREGLMHSGQKLFAQARTTRFVPTNRLGEFSLSLAA